MGYDNHFVSVCVSATDITLAAIYIAYIKIGCRREGSLWHFQDSYILIFVAFVNALFNRSLAAKNASQGMAKDIIFFSHTDYCFPSSTLASLLISKEGGADAIHVYLVYCVVLF